MKTKEKPNALNVEVETLTRKLTELSEEELEQVSGGGDPFHNIDLPFDGRAFRQPGNETGVIGIGLDANTVGEGTSAVGSDSQAIGAESSTGRMERNGIEN